MAVVASGSLPCTPLDVVRRRPFPGGCVAEVGEALLAVKIEHFRIRGHMADQHVPVPGIGGLFVGVAADLHGFHFPLVLEKRDPLLVLAHVAAIAVDIGLGMTHLALHLVFVDGVFPDRTDLQLLVAVDAGRHFFQVIAAPGVLGCCGVHFIGIMTADAIHARFGGVDIPLAAHAIELIAHAAAVAGGALVEGV